MAKLTKKQAEALLAAYTKEQTDAANAAITAYDGARDAEVAAVEREVAADTREALRETREALDGAAVKALIDRYAVRDAVAGLGLSQSGTADTALATVEHTRRRTAADARVKQREVLSALSEKLVSARESADAKKAQNAATIRRTLAGKIAEKRLSLGGKV